MFDISLGAFEIISINSRYIMTGKIKTLAQQGYGFISREEESDVFFHMNDLEGVTFEELNEGDEVTFEMGEGPKGPKAVNVARA